MKHVFKKILCASLLLSFAGIAADSCCPTESSGSCGGSGCNVAPYYSIRSQSSNTALHYAGLTGHIHLFDMEKMHGTFAVTPAYFQSFRPDAITKCLFGTTALGGGTTGNQCCDTINISGSLAEGLTGTPPNQTINARPAHHLLADYFFLPTDFKSTVKFSPKVQNFLLDLDLYVGLDEWRSGLYFRAHAPINWTKWDLNCCETVSAKGTRAHQEGYFRGVPVDRSDLLKDFTEYLSGKSISVSGIHFEGLRCSKCPNCDTTKTGVADLRLYFGYNFANNEDYHFGLNIQTALPTGNAPDGEFLLEPIIGNGNHWELGAGANGHAIFWRSEDEEKQFGFYADLNLTHLFKTRQKRCFDLKCKELSRFMLAAKHRTSNIKFNLQQENGSTTTGATKSTAQFFDAFAPVANLTHSSVDVSVGIQADLSAFFNYTSGGFGWDIGYNFFGRSCEKIRCDCKCPPRLQTEANTWTLKGDAHVVGFSDSDAGFGEGNPVNLAVSQCGATIFTGLNRTSGTRLFGDSSSSSTNPRIDNPQLAEASMDVPNATNLFDSTSLSNRSQTRTSIQVKFLSEGDIDYCGAETKIRTHKIFTHLGYNWMDKKDWIPYIGVGASAEFGNSDDCCDTDCCPTVSGDTCCPKCNDCSMSQWGIWVKGGVSF